MARKNKPPGMEKWTWEEIRAGRKMPKGEKRVRRMAKSLGATEKSGGELEHTTGSVLAIVGLFVLMLGVALLAECGKR
jgi:hypothetical protein